jgi:hypothetical protein
VVPQRRLHRRAQPQGRQVGACPPSHLVRPWSVGHL